MTLIKEEKKQLKEYLDSLEKVDLDKAEISKTVATRNDLLMEAKWPKLATNEQRILVYFLALINRDDKDFKYYKIPIKDLMRVFKTNNNNDSYNRFENACEGLMTKPLKWQTPEKKKKMATFCAYAGLDEKRGYVELSFHPELKPFLLALQDKFTVYEVRAMLRLKGYFLKLYMLIKYHQGQARWKANVLGPEHNYTSVEEDLDWLKEFLQVPSNQYEQWSHFKTRILEKGKKELKLKTDVLFDYEGQKDGRKVKRVKITWKYNPKYDQLELPLPNDNNLYELDKALYNKLIEFGLNDQAVYDLLHDESKSMEWIENELDKIKERYLFGTIDGETVKEPIKNINRYIEGSLKIPKGSVTKIPKIVKEKEEWEEKLKKKKEKETKERAEKERIEVLFWKYDDDHKKYLEKRLIEVLKENGKFPALKNKELIQEFEKDIINQFQKPIYDKQGGLKSRMFQSQYQEWLIKKFLSENERNIRFFIKNVSESYESTDPKKDYKDIAELYKWTD